MTWFSNRPAARTLAGTGALGMAVALTGAFGTPVAAAAPIPLKYDIQGAAHVVKMDTDIPIDATYALNFDVSTGKFDGEFKQKQPAHVKFKAFGSFDSELDVEFSQAGPSVGQFKDSKVTMDLPLQVKIRNLVAVGYPGAVGENCVLKEPAKIPMASTTPFNPAQGGELEGKFTLAEFNDSCGPLTFVINMSGPGPDNTSHVKLTKTG